MPPVRLTDKIGRVVGGRYRLVAPIGAGASAEVFLADDVRSKRQVAVKLLHASLADEVLFLRRFEREVESAAALDHPNIVSVLDWGDDHGLPFLVTEYLAGGSLRDVLDASRLTPAQGLMIGLDTARALDYAHRRGIVHRDIKPANLLLGDDHRLRIADFGLARALAEAAITEPSGALLGTARYASPEQAKGQPLEGQSDVYSLALVMVEAVTGSVPFASDTTIGTLMARIDQRPDLPDSIGPLRSSLERALDPDATTRPDAGDFGISLMASAERFDEPEPIPLAPPDISVDDALVHPSDAGTDAGSGSDGPADTTVAVGAASLDDERAASPEPDGGERRRRWPVIVAAAVFALVLGAGAAFAFVQSQVASHEVPDLDGMQEIDARAAVDEFGWKIETAEDRELDTEPGEIIRTRPVAGESLEEGETLLLVVSRGNPTRRVPEDLVGSTREAAEAALTEAGFEVDVDEQFDEDVEVGLVIRLAPGQAIEAPIGEAIPLVVSLGPRPRIVPDGLPGGSFDAAATALEEVQLVADRVDVFSDTVDDGVVVATSPAEGAEVARDSTVRVQVSKGPDLVAIPDVAGKSLDEATAALESAGLVPGSVFGPAKGTPDSTDPEAGVQVKRGASVDIYLKN